MAEGDPKPQVMWFFNDRPINVTTAPSYLIDGGNLTVLEMTSQHEGKYGCLLNNDFFVVSSIAMVNITRSKCNMIVNRGLSLKHTVNGQLHLKT